MNRYLSLTATLSISFLLVFAFASAAHISAGVGVKGWVGTGSYPGGTVAGYPNYLPSCVTSSGYVYCLGGVNLAGYDTNSTYYAPISSSGIGTWTESTNYPIGVAGQSCVTSSSDIYCVGGVNSTYDRINSTYYAPISSSGIGTWNQSTSYPIGIVYQSCVTSFSDIYCVGGQSSTYHGVNSTYYAPISSSGIGTWASTGSYISTGIWAESCLSTSSEVYCVGGVGNAGFSATVSATNSTFYASLSASGVGTWAQGTDYPTYIAGESCVTSSGYIYCVGGANNSSVLGYEDLNSTYYAPVSSSGIGTWTQSTSYPTPIAFQSCIASSSDIYCVGGVNSTYYYINSTYYAPISSSGIGNWTETASYPFPVLYQSCVSTSADLYCTGGFYSVTDEPSNSSYFSSMSSSTSSSTTTSTVSSSSSTTTVSSTRFPATDLYLIVGVVVAFVVIGGVMLVMRRRPRV